MGDLVFFDKKLVFEALELEMLSSVEAFSKEVAKLSMGNVNIQFIKDINVKAYGSSSPMYQVATITCPNAISAIITPWDKSIIKSIVEAVEDAYNKEIVPNVRDNSVYLNFPAVTEEKKREYLKIIKDKAEDYRNRIRNHRQNAKADIEKAKKEGYITEDEYYKFVEELDDLTRKYTEEVNKVYEKKKASLL